jgi:hypothetical protein
MRECFGVHFGYFMEDKVSSYDERKQCYECEDFDKCYKISLIRSLQALKVEIRTGVRGLRNSLGGSHSDFPLGF